MRLVPLSKGMCAAVDDEDYERVTRFRWYASIESSGTKVYAVRRCLKDEPGYRPGLKTKIRMHCFVLNRPPLIRDGLVVDHINGDSLDNRKENLELKTQEQNMSHVAGWAGRKRLAEEDLVL